MNDIEERLTELNCNYIKINVDVLDQYLEVLVLMYADDTAILSDSNEEMTRALAALEVYCREWKLEVNCSITKMLFSAEGGL